MFVIQMRVSCFTLQLEATEDQVLKNGSPNPGNSIHRMTMAFDSADCENE